MAASLRALTRMTSSGPLADVTLHTWPDESCADQSLGRTNAGMRMTMKRVEYSLGEMQRHVYIRIPVRALINLTGKGVKSMEIERRHPESVRSWAEISKLQHQRKVEERRK